MVLEVLFARIRQRDTKLMMGEYWSREYVAERLQTIVTSTKKVLVKPRYDLLRIIRKRAMGLGAHSMLKFLMEGITTLPRIITASNVIENMFVKAVEKGVFGSFGGIVN